MCENTFVDNDRFVKMLDFPRNSRCIFTVYTIILPLTWKSLETLLRDGPIHSFMHLRFNLSSCPGIQIEQKVIYLSCFISA